MPCIDRRLAAPALFATLLLVSCSSAPPPGERAPAPSPSARPPSSTARPALPAPTAVRNWDDYRRQAAARIVAANPGATYDTAPPDVLLAIPVLEIELNSDGSVRHVEVLREPRQAKDTIQLAVAAVRRAGPFGDVSRLPRPWKFRETFLFNDDRKFRLRSLVD